MDMKKKVEEWAKRMGYKGNIPDCFNNICGPETAHIWEQLITKVKPKEEIEHIRRNIIIHELKGNLPEHLRGRSKAIQAYYKKKELESQKNKLEGEVAEKMENLENLKANINSKQAKKEKLKKQININKTKEFWYKKKCVDFKKRIEEIQSKLTHLENNRKTLKRDNQKEIVDGLNKLSEKINLSQHNISTSVVYSEIFTKNSCFFEHSQFLEVETSLNQKIDVLNNKNFNDDVKKIVSIHDFNQTLSTLSNLINETKVKIIEITSKKPCYNPKQVTANKTLNLLYAEDIKNRLKVLKCNQVIAKEQNDFEQQLKLIHDQLKCLNFNQNEIESMRKLIELKLREVETVAKMDYLQKELNKFENSQVCDFKSVETKIARFEKQVGDYNQKIDEIVLLSKDISEAIKNTQHETDILISGLERFSSKITSLSTLLEKKLIKKEVEVFKNYDLVYNEKVVLKTGEIFVRNLLNHFIDDDCFKQLRGSLINIYAPPEMIVLELIRNKTTLTMELGMGEKVQYKKYSLKQFEDKQKSVNDDLKRLEVLHKQNVLVFENSNIQPEKMIKFWLEMPIDKFVNKTLLINGNNFEYYKKLYEKFYKQL